MKLYYLNIADLPMSFNDIAYSSLEPHRKERYDKTKNEKIKLEIAATDALVKYAVSSEYSVSPLGVKTAYHANGSPYLVSIPINISITHTDLAVIVALSQNKIGVDAENIRSIKADIIAERFFSPGEKALVFASEHKNDESYKNMTALAIWTAKEAYFKYSNADFSSPIMVDTSSLLPPKRIFHDGHIISAVGDGEEPAALICVHIGDILKLYGEAYTQ